MANCVEGVVQPKCYKLESRQFLSEENIIDVLLDLLKSELPAKLQGVLDCHDNPMVMSEDDIGLTAPFKFSKFNVILEQVSDRPRYLDTFKRMRDVTYNFQAILTVNCSVPECAYWEFIRFKNVVDEIITAAELYIGGYNGVNLTPTGVDYIPVDQVDANMFRRQGAYRFSVTVTQTSIG